VKVIVHYNSLATQPYGIWWLDEESASPVCEYLRPGGPEEARGKLIMFSKQNSDLSWSRWFDELTTRHPYIEDWIAYDSMGMTPHQILMSLVPNLAS
jgi:hypothetical protein